MPRPDLPLLSLFEDENGIVRVNVGYIELSFATDEERKQAQHADNDD